MDCPCADKDTEKKRGEGACCRVARLVSGPWSPLSRLVLTSPPWKSPWTLLAWQGPHAPLWGCTVRKHSSPFVFHQSSFATALGGQWCSLGEAKAWREEFVPGVPQLLGCRIGIHTQVPCVLQHICELDFKFI